MKLKKLDIMQAVLFVVVCALLDWSLGTLVATVNGICGGILLARVLLTRGDDDGK